MTDNMKPVTEYTLEETLSALNVPLAAFEKEYYSPVKAAQRRCRKVSRTLEKLLKQYRRVTIADGKEE